MPEYLIHHFHRPGDFDFGKLNDVYENEYTKDKVTELIFIGSVFVETGRWI